VHDLRIAVVGAGIGGLSAGIALRRAGFMTEVYERAPEIQPIGAGLCLWPNGAKAVNALGLERRMEEISPAMRAVQFRTRDGELLSDIDLHPLVQTTGQRPYPVARADLQQLLFEEYGSSHVRLGRECVRIEEEADGRPVVVFADGGRAAADLVVGADGLRSTVREHVVGASTLRPLSWDWEGLVTAVPGLNPPDVFTFYVGDGKRASMMPVARNRFYFFFDFQEPPAGLDGMREQLELLYEGWCEPVRMLVDAASREGAGHLHLHDLEPIETFIRGRVVLLGDAAHGMTPFLGQGAAMAVEDALVLAHYLQTTSVSVEDALRRYEAERKARTSAIVAGARAKGEAAVGVDLDANERYYEELRRGSRDFVEAVEQATFVGPLR
jgi:FAD-dependent urate hydroxylase